MTQLGVKFNPVPPRVEESARADESPRQMVERLALAKARSVADSMSTGLVIGADSVVVLAEKILGKPVDGDQAREMLKSLRGRGHRVITGVAVVDAAGGKVWVASESTGVTMRKYSDQEIDDYVATGSPMDKAGAYAVQDTHFQPTSGLEGCYTNVVGLPMCLLANMLEEAGFQFTQRPNVRDSGKCSSCPMTSGP